uniref:CobW C-terminal domain-containing protein n=1 Tax=Guillardia theta TaxID=55529 RepID=A0A7S4P808_GUITH|mmetsp:Transcript_45021/g.141736  ORF Transcript_45021/g.141736 Transcript_45021/m.141736 type:complete len:556 (+) Transcript_45021:247-1914(+)
MKTDDSSVPVTLLGGFLGSGKTTILKHILENQVGLKVGVIVNDVASVNIDAKLVRGVTSSSVPGGSDTIELQNGCACCSISDELFSAVEKLVETGRARGNQFDHILVELSGVAEPSIVKSNFERGKAAGLKSALDARIKQIVTVVDSSEFVQQWMSEERLGEVSRLAPEVGQDCAAARAVSEFLAEQIEAADVVVLNKVDMVDSSTVKTTARIVDGLLHEKKHKLIETSWGKIPIQSLFSEDAEVEQVAHEAKHEHEGHSHDEACHDPHCQDQSHEHHHAHSHDEHCDDPHCTDQAHGHSHSHEQQKTTAEEKIGISSFVYRARRPFDTDRLFKLVKSWPIPRKDAETYLYKLLNDREFIKGKEETSDGRVLQPVFRSKGFIWLDSMPTRIRYWSHVGRYFALEDAGKWWADTEEKLLEAVKVASPSDYEAIMKDDWEGEFGDRRQELVFIGAGMKEEAIRKALDRCLLTEEEMVKFRQELEQVIEAESNPRFKVGDKVVCQCGTWLPGVVIKIGYREPDWPITKPDAPYQVKLEDGTLIYVPFDEDDFIRPRKG